MPFSKGTIEFLFENRMRDSREWFEEHRTDYQKLVLEPLQELVIALTPRMLKIDSRFVIDPKVDKTICRIRRDTRFTRDPAIYRDHMWIIFKVGRMHGTEVPGIYFEVNQDGFSYGCGFYDASAAYMDTLRKLVLEGHPSFLKAQRAFEKQDVFRMDGERYKRPRYLDQPEPLRQWLELRGLSFNADCHDFELLFSDRLADKVGEDLLLLAPVYQFLLDVSAQVQQIQALQRNAERK